MCIVEVLFLFVENQCQECIWTTFDWSYASVVKNERRDVEFSSEWVDITDDVLIHYTKSVLTNLYDLLL